MAARPFHSRSGGILSNLLRLQALSTPALSHRRKRRRHRHQSHDRRKGIGRRPSVASEVISPTFPWHILSSPNASVISLPGLLMTAPSGIGMNTNAASSSTTMRSPEPSRSLNTPVIADNGLRTSTSSGSNQGFKTPGNGYSSIMSPTTPKDTNLSPETLGAGGGGGGGGEATRYLQTHPPY
ncbi:MAG: hypothetical protein J3Q66DRAFT_335302, partial [Benniella sp.]